MSLKNSSSQGEITHSITLMDMTPPEKTTSSKNTNVSKYTTDTKEPTSTLPMDTNQTPKSSTEATYTHINEVFQ